MVLYYYNIHRGGKPIGEVKHNIDRGEPTNSRIK